MAVAYEQLRQTVPAAPVIHTDDTGWRVEGRTAFLMGFDTDQVTVYQIRDQHRNEEVREVIGNGHGGVLVLLCYKCSWLLRLQKRDALM